MTRSEQEIVKETLEEYRRDSNVLGTIHIIHSDQRISEIPAILRKDLIIDWLERISDSEIESETVTPELGNIVVPCAFRIERCVDSDAEVKSYDYGLVV